MKILSRWAPLHVREGKALLIFLLANGQLKLLPNENKPQVAYGCLHYFGAPPTKAAKQHYGQPLAKCCFADFSQDKYR